MSKSRYDELINDDSIKDSKEEIIEEPVTEVLIEGIVANCKRLNVRENADINSNVKTILDCGASVIIDKDNSVDGWYRIVTTDNVDGFCMDKYIDLI